MRSYTANRRALRFGVVAAKAASGCLLTTERSAAFDPELIHRWNALKRLFKVLQPHGIARRYRERMDVDHGDEPLRMRRQSKRLVSGYAGFRFTNLGNLIVFPGEPGSPPEQKQSADLGAFQRGFLGLVPVREYSARPPEA